MADTPDANSASVSSEGNPQSNEKGAFNGDSNFACSPGGVNVGHLDANVDKLIRTLDDKRTESSIPSREKRWYFPSERQFYKTTIGKGHNVDASLVPAIVKIHNAVNEKAWEKVMEYEALHEHECEKPILSHFVGKKDALSIRARIRHWLGYKKPYDRHDWTVDRCGKQIRYIIDFYEGKRAHYFDMAVYIDARPELTFGGAVDRARLWWMNKYRKQR